MVKQANKNVINNQIVRLLKPNEIECRVAMINEKGLTLLLYKDARVDQKILDETFTPMGWKRSHQSIDGQLYCTVEIWDDVKQQWISKQDVGTASFAEKEKGQASDAFKRACFNFSIGRELYSAPFIWISADKVSMQKRPDGKYVTYDKFSVSEIDYNSERDIVSLQIVNQLGKIVYEMGINGAGQASSNNSVGLSKQQLDKLKKELTRTGVSIETVFERYHINGADEMTPEIYKNAIDSLNKTKSVA